MLGAEAEKLPYGESKILDLTYTERLQWAIKIEYAYTLGQMEPIGSSMVYAKTSFDMFSMVYDGSKLTFYYGDLALGYIVPSQTLLDAIEANGKTMLGKIREELELFFSAVPNHEQQIYIEERDKLIPKAIEERKAIYFESAAPGTGYYVFPCGCCRSSWGTGENEPFDPVEATCGRHLSHYED